MNGNISLRKTFICKHHRNSGLKEIIRTLFSFCSLKDFPAQVWVAHSCICEFAEKTVGWAAGRGWLVGGEGVMTNPISSLFFCLCNNSAHCHHISTFCYKSQCPLAFGLLKCISTFSQAARAVFLWVARLPQITKIAWVLDSEPSYSPIYYLVLLFLNSLIIHMVKEIPFGPFKTARLADLNTQPQLLLDISVLYWNGPFNVVFNLIK